MPSTLVRTAALLSLRCAAVLGWPGVLVAQSADSARAVVPTTSADWHLQTTAFYSSANNGYGIWRGGELRLLHSGPRFSPFVNIGTQSRPNGRQEALGVGSYVVLTPWAYSIVGVGTAPDRGTVLFPRIRSDASLFLAAPGVRGLILSVGVTDLRFSDPRAGGTILSLGTIFYHGRGIYSGAVFANHDRASGARSTAWQAGAQWGGQGTYWLGVGVGSGNEAYRLLSATPFDARFRSNSASAFGSKWITARSGFTVRFDFEQKVNVFDRRAAALIYFVDF